MNIKVILYALTLAAVGLTAACDLTAPTPIPQSAALPAGPAAWIDAPLDQSSLPLAQYLVVSHASDPSGISSFELSVDGKVYHTDPAPGDQAGGTIVHIQQAWLPDTPGEYLLALRAANAHGDFGPYAYAHVTVDNAKKDRIGKNVPIAVPEMTPAPTFTTTPTKFPNPLVPNPAVITVVGLVDTNCHSGPDVLYNVNGTLKPGASLQIYGRNADSSWVWVQHPFVKDARCWLNVSVIQVNGDISPLPIIPAPPLPGAPASNSSGGSTRLKPTVQGATAAPPTPAPTAIFK